MGRDGPSISEMVTQPWGVMTPLFFTCAVVSQELNGPEILDQGGDQFGIKATLELISMGT